jgi:hypothetical protein
LDKNLRRKKSVKKHEILALVFLLAIIVPLAVPMARAAETLSKPTVTLPSSDWQMTTDNPYPTDVSEHDPAGAGLLEYTDQNTYDFVMIYYEKAPSTVYTSTSLQAEAVSIFQRDHNDTVIDSGSSQYAGVNAGYAKGYDSGIDAYRLELVFVKSNYYFNVYAFYDANTPAQNRVNSLINSIDVSGSSLLGDSMLFIIIGVIAAVVVVVVVVIVMRGRKKKSAQSSQTSPQYSYPPPPAAPTS